MVMEMVMSQWSESDGAAPGAQDLSGLLDGELDEAAVDRACAHWRGSERARADWHAYLLIGDVLRSEDLAATAAQDSAFLAGLRARLAEEPVVLAPAASTPMPAVPRRHWRSSIAVAAGFAAVAGVLVVTQMSATGPGAPLVASAPAPAAAGLATVSAMAGPALAPPLERVVEPADDVLNGQLVRDARLDEYLAAHKKFGGSSAPGGPSGFMRNAAAEGR